MLERRWRVETLAILLPEISLLTRSLLSPLRRRRRFLPPMLLIVLSHYGLTRPVPVALAAKRLLLLRSGIPIP